MSNIHMSDKQKTITDAIASLPVPVNTLLAQLWTVSGLEDKYNGDLVSYVQALSGWLELRLNESAWLHAKLAEINKISGAKMVTTINVDPVGVTPGDWKRDGVNDFLKSHGCSTI